MKPERHFQIGELAELAGISRRSVRYYVQRRLLPPPLGAGRGHYYTGGHLELLLSIKILQDRGLTLDEIERHLVQGKAGGTGAPDHLSQDTSRSSAGGVPDHAPGESPPDLSLWTRVGLAEGIELHIEGGRYRLSPGRMRRLRAAVKAIIGEPFSPGDDDTQGEDDHD